MLDVDDLFPLNATEFSDFDMDGLGDNADTDDDNDGWMDTDETVCKTPETVLYHQMIMIAT